MKPLSWYRDLSEPRKRKEYGCFLVEGPRALEQIGAIAPGEIVELLVAEGFAGETAFIRCPVRRLSERQFSSITSAKTPQGIAAVVRIPGCGPEDQLPTELGKKLLLLDGIQDPGNIGTLIRTAAGLDFNGIVLNGECADPFSPKAVQASAGSVLAVWLRRTERCLDHAHSLKDQGFTLLAATLEGTPITDCRVKEPFVIMLGSEGSGLGAPLLELADAKVAIPMNRAGAESLNVAVAGGILMYSLGNIRSRCPCPLTPPV